MAAHLPRTTSRDHGAPMPPAAAPTSGRAAILPRCWPMADRWPRTCRETIRFCEIVASICRQKWIYSQIIKNSIKLQLCTKGRRVANPRHTRTHHARHAAHISQRIKDHRARAEFPESKALATNIERPINRLEADDYPGMGAQPARTRRAPENLMRGPMYI